MWKKPNLPNPAPDSSSDSVSAESMGEKLMDIVRAADSPEPQAPPALQSECNQTDQQALLPMLQDYTESAEKCLLTAGEFLRQASLIPQAVEAYEKLIKTRAEIRKVLDKDETVFRALMDEVQKVGEIARKPAEFLSQRKPAESSKIATMPIASGDNTRMSKFP
jgi:hypothetical protein